MKLHVLPGDATVATFKEANIDGEIAVCREALIEGDVSGDTLAAFWANRAAFNTSAHGETTGGYLESVAGELEKLLSVSEGDTGYLWFEYELFCQVNYWFCLDLLKATAAYVFRVSPIIRQDADKWMGFGSLTADDLKSCFAARIQVSADDIKRGSELWQAYRTGDADGLRKLAGSGSSAFPMLAETVEAAIAKDERPRAILREIVDEGIDDFARTFEEFSKRAGVYGYGDAQVRRILNDL
ncbi:MAG: hypothetical protein ABI791_09350 [Acidobacteriota bacterium]